MKKVPLRDPAIEKCPVDTFRKKNLQPFSRGSVFALPILPCRPMYYRGVGTVRWTVTATFFFDIVKAPHICVELFCVRVTYLPG